MSLGKLLPTSGIDCGVTVRLDINELAIYSPEQLAAIWAGIGFVLAANEAMKRDSNQEGSEG